MNVGIQETDHFEGVYPVIRLFDNGSNELYIFVNEETYQRLVDLLGENAGRYHWVLQRADQSTWAYCQVMRKTILDKGIKLIYLNTISRHHLFYAISLPFRKIPLSILTVHDVNCLFSERIGYTPRSWIRYLGKKLLTQRVTAFNTVADTVKPYLQKQVKKYQQVFTVPGAVFEKKQTMPLPLQPFHMVIPGSIDPKRRDYHLVFELLQVLGPFPVKISLLGGGKGAYAENIWKRCKELTAADLQWFETSLVDQSVFDECINSAHFIWVPSVVNTTICGAIPETYGLTKSSGNIFDIIKHAKPFFYPRSLSVPAALRQSGVDYSTVEELAIAIHYYYENSNAYAEIASFAGKASALFTIDNLRKVYAPLFEPDFHST